MVQRVKGARARTSHEAAIEWVGGRKTMPFYITEGDGFRPEMVVWLQLPDGLIVGHDLIAPGVDPSVARSLRGAIKSTGVTPKRVRVADEQLASEVRAAFGDRVDLRVAPTPELDFIFADLARAVPGDVPTSYFGGEVDEGTVARMFRAAHLLYRAAPWAIATDDQVLRLDIPSLGIDGACVSIIGKLGQSTGLIVFPSYVAYEGLVDGADQASQGPFVPGAVDLGTSVLSLDFDRRGDVPPSMRDEIARHRWPVAGPKAYPSVMRRDRDGVPAPLTRNDVRIATECAFALTTFFLQHRPEFARKSFDPACASYETDDSGVTVRLTLPYDGQSLLPVRGPTPIARPEVPRSKLGRNDPCSCGSGSKYKKCCLAEEDHQRGEQRSYLANHELDNRLVESIHRYAMNRFGDAWRSGVTDIGELLGKEGNPLQLLMPWTAYTLEMEGKPVNEWFQEDRAGHLSPAEREWLDVQREAWLSVWEVLESEPGKGVTVRDLLSGETRRVKEVSGSRSMVRGDALLCRVVTQGDLTVFCGMFPRLLPPDAAASVVDRARRRLRAKGAVAPARLRGEAIGRALIEWWAKAVHDGDLTAATPPKLHNTDGDPLMLTTDHFTFQAPARAKVLLALETIEGLVPPEDGDSDGYSFVRPGNPMHKSWDNTIIGRASVGVDGLTVETNSVKRADGLRKLVEGAGRGLIRHRAREHADPTSKAAPRGAVPRERPVPGPEEIEVVREFKKAHYQSWLDDPVPALGGKTPREATRSERGRAEVDLLLRTMEHSEQRAAPGARFDFAELRRELDLPPT